MESCAGLHVPVFDLHDEWRLQRNWILRRAMNRTYADPSQPNTSSARRFGRIIPAVFRQGNQRLLEILADNVAGITLSHDSPFIEPDHSVAQALYSGHVMTHEQDC